MPQKTTRFTIITPERSIGFALFAIFLVLFGFCAAPDVTWGDSGEFASVVQTLGIAHPTGYPLYIMVGKVLTTLSPATPARTLNLFSAFCAALTIWAFFHLILRVFELLRPCFKETLPEFFESITAILMAAALGLSPVFFSQAVITEVYALSNLFQVLLWLSLVNWWLKKGGLKIFFLILGLAMAHHLTILIFAPFMFFIVLLGLRQPDRDQKEILFAAPLALPGLALYLYIPLRAAAEPALNWGDPSSLDGLLWVIRGGDFRGLLKFDPLFDNFSRTMKLVIQWHANRLEGQFGGLSYLFPLALVGYIGTLAYREIRSRLLPLGLMILAVLFSAFYFSFYMVGDQAIFFAMTYPLTVLLIAAITIAIIVWVWKKIGSIQSQGSEKMVFQLRLAAAGIFLLLIAGTVLKTGLLSVAHECARNDRGAQAFGAAIMDELPPGSLILVGLREGESDNSIYPLWYQKWALGRGEDVAVMGSNFFNSPWYQYQLPDDVWFPERADLKRRGLASETDGLGVAFVSRGAWIRTIILFLQKNAPNRTLYTLSWMTELEPYFEKELVIKAPVDPGVVPDYYKPFLPGDGSLYRLTPRGEEIPKKETK